MILYLVIIQLFFKYSSTASAEECRLEQIDEVLAMVADFSDALKWNRMVLFSDRVKDERDAKLTLKNMGSVHLMLRGLPWNTSQEILQVNVNDHLAIWCSNFSRCQNEIYLQYAVHLYIGSELPISSSLPMFVAKPLQLQNSLCLECCEKNNFTISFVTATNDSEEIGDWSHVNGVQIQNVSRWILKEVYNKNLTILVREQSPYVFHEQNEKGEMVLTGFIIEMLADFSECLNFSYTIQISSDRRTGIEESNSSWSGLMGALQRGEVDLLASDVSISSNSRLRVADFSEPFIRTSSAILVRRVLFANFGHVYISAFEVMVWCLIVLVVLMTAVCVTVTWAVEKSSKRRGVLAICNHTYQYSWWEAVYMLTINLFEQGNDVRAERFSTRIILIAFLLFSVVILAYNNSVLTAHLAVVNFRPPFETIEDLMLNAPQYQIGIVNGGSYYYMFESSENPGFQLAWKRISANPENIFNSTSEAVHQVATGNTPIAFIDSSFTIRYEIRDSCDFVMVELKGGTRGYHLAFPKGSRYVNAFSQQIRDWKVSGLFQRLEVKYFASRSLCTAKEDIVSLGLGHLMGIFIVLLVGFVIGSVVLCAEKMLSHLEELRKVNIKKKSPEAKSTPDIKKYDFTVKHKAQYYSY